MILKNKNILLAVSGSVAIYKALELVRLYIKSGATVRVVMSNSAKKFTTPLLFETISQNKILDDCSESWDKNNLNNQTIISKLESIEKKLTRKTNKNPNLKNSAIKKETEESENKPLGIRKVFRKLF